MLMAPNDGGAGTARHALYEPPSWNGQTPFCHFSLHYSRAFFN